KLTAHCSWFLTWLLEINIPSNKSTNSHPDHQQRRNSLFASLNSEGMRHLDLQMYIKPSDYTVMDMQFVRNFYHHVQPEFAMNEQ
ncbi:hypothetical protein FGIG_11579, partial [Fasciola gigantica]